MDHEQRISSLERQLGQLTIKAHAFQLEISEIQSALRVLKAEKEIPKVDELAHFPVSEPKPEVNELESFISPKKASISDKVRAKVVKQVTFDKTNWEKFIGENLINKLGVLIIVLGVAIGAKYAIDHEMVSPLTRIVLGYLSSIALLGTALKLKAKYEAFSAVLLSGAMAIMYFITYAAYDFYGLIPQLMAFALMVVFTFFTVAAAINYNKQVIAHIGLVGAYAVPFLLSNGSGKVATLFTYMALINVGILFISFKRYWKPLFYVSFLMTWLVYSGWLFTDYSFHSHYTIAFVFLAVFYVIFYATFLAYKLVKKEKYNAGDALLILSNSFVFYGQGYFLLDDHTTGQYLLGLFTLLNAIVHFIVSMVIFKQKLADKNLFYMSAGLVLVFITIAIPVQLDGHWVTLLWAAETLLLFWVGRVKKVKSYEKLAYPLIFLSCISIFHDWDSAYSYYNLHNQALNPFFNIQFLSSLLFAVFFFGMTYVLANHQTPTVIKDKNGWFRVLSYVIPVIFVGSLFMAFFWEIINYWSSLSVASTLEITEEDGVTSRFMNDYDLNDFEIVWELIYTLSFVLIIQVVNKFSFKDEKLENIGLLAGLIVVFFYLSHGGYALSNLRESYLTLDNAIYYKRSFWHVGIRYLSYIPAVLILVFSIVSLKESKHGLKNKNALDLFVHFCILWMASLELINIMELSGFMNSDKLVTSILWGVYSLMMIVIGISSKKKHIRIAAISLFGITLIKLFFYDIAELETIAKTVVFVALGVLLLIISFLYNKYKYMIFEEDNLPENEGDPE